MTNRQNNLKPGRASEAMRCNSITLDGSRCSAPKLHGLDFCRQHVPREANTGEIKSAPSMPLTTLDEVQRAVADTINKVRNGVFSPQQGSTLSSLFGRLQDGIFEKTKNDPKNIAARTLTEQTARRIAETMDIRTAREIATNRGAGIIEALIAEATQEEVAQITALDLTNELNKVISEVEEKSNGGRR